MITVRIPETLLSAIRADLERPHEFAGERIGFVIGRSSVAMADQIVLLSRYQTILDGDYLRDKTVGARIGGEAIRKAMQLALSERACCFHVHMHPHAGAPGWSLTDLKEIPPIARSLACTVPAAVHGALLLSQDRAIGFTFDARLGTPVPIAKIASVGERLRLWAKGDGHGGC